MPCHFHQFNGLSFSPLEQQALSLSSHGPHYALSTSAPGSLPPSPRRSEVNRRRGLKTTPTLLQNDPPYHGYSISFHYAPCSTDYPTTLLFLFRFLSLSRLALTPVLLISLPLRLSASTSATKHERRRIFIVTSRAVSSDLPPNHPPTPSTQRLLLYLFFMRLLTISSNCAHPPPPLLALPIPCLTVAEPFRETVRKHNGKRDDTCVGIYCSPRAYVQLSLIMLPQHDTGK